MVLVINTIKGTTGVGDMTLIRSKDIAKRSFVIGLVFERIFVKAYLSISDDRLM